MYKGSIVAIITPFNGDLSINYNKLTELLEWHIEQKTDGIVILGTTGETPTLTEDEKLQVFKHTVEVVNGRVPVIAGTGSNNTAQTTEFSKKVEVLGVDALLIVSPYYNRSNPQGLINHFTAVADQVNIPIILYNVPGRTGINIPESVVLALSTHPNIIGIKEASGNIGYVMKIAQYITDDFALWSGNDNVVLPLLAIGGSGVISVAANVVPTVMHDLVDSFLQGHIEQARTIQLSYLKLINSLFIENNPIPVKEMMNQLGMDVGGFRLPLYEAEETTKHIIASIIKEYSL